MEGVLEEEEDAGEGVEDIIETAVTPEAQAATLRTTRLVNPVAMVGAAAAAVRLPLNRRSMPTRHVPEGTMAGRTPPSWSSSVA